MRPLTALILAALTSILMAVTSMVSMGMAAFSEPYSEGNQVP